MAAELTPAKIKTLISDPKHRIELHDRVHEETERLYALVSGMNPHNDGDATEKAKAWIEKIENESKTLRQLFAYGCYFGTEDQSRIWTRSLNRLGSLVHMNGLTVMVNLQLYPAMLVLYTGGVAAVAAGNAPSLRALLSAAYQEPHQGSGLLVERTNGWLLDGNQGNAVLGLERRKTPLSDHVHDIIAEDFPETLIVKDDFALEYDRWDVLLCMVVAHDRKEKESGQWAPVGRFAWRRETNGKAGLDVLHEEIQANQQSWPPLTVGLFNASVKDAQEAHEFVKSMAQRVSFF